MTDPYRGGPAGPDRDGPDRGLEDALRSALQHSAPASDYDDLVLSVHHKVGVKRRRRAIGTGVVAVAAVGVFATGGAVVLGNIGEGEVTPAAQMTNGAAPFQPVPPPNPPGGSYEDGNAWDVPDARPTGIDSLDALGAPSNLVATPGLNPLSGVLICASGPDADGLSDASLSSHYEGQTDSEIQSVRISITGWEDGGVDLDQFRNGEVGCTWPADRLNEVDWTGEGDGLLTPPYPSGTGRQVTGAMVDVGDYTVGVTVESNNDQLAADTAVEIAGATAANLEALDPERAGS